MHTKRIFSLILAVSILLLALGVEPTHAWSPARQVVPPDQGFAVAANGSPLGQSFVIIADPEQEVYPSVAYNSQRQEYLVVWYNDRAGCDDIRAQRVSKNGALVGGPFYISAGCPADRRYPDVAYNSAHD